METGSGTAFSSISETAFLGLQSQDHGNQDCIYGTAFLRSQESGLYFNITEAGSYFYDYG